MLYIIRTTGKALVMAAVMALPLSSCIKEEALNAEADITGVSDRGRHHQSGFGHTTTVL